MVGGWPLHFQHAERGILRPVYNDVKLYVLSAVYLVSGRPLCDASYSANSSESTKFRKLRVEEAPFRLVVSLQNIVWFTTCKQWYIFHYKKPVTITRSRIILHKQRCFSSNRRNFFSIRIARMWNSLSAKTTDFSELDKFNNSVSNMFLLKFCQVNFEWISPCDTETYCSLRFYVITCIIVLFYNFYFKNCFITLLQHVRGQSGLCCQINVCMYLHRRN